MIRCKVCNTIKPEEGNYWWGLFLTRSLPSDKGQLTDIRVKSLAITPLSACVGAESSAYEKACGNNCTQKLVERWLTTGSMDAPRAPAGDAA